MCRLQKFIVLRFASAYWCSWKLNRNNREIFFSDASQSHSSYQANLPCIKHICGISRMWGTMFPKGYLIYFDRLLLSNELLGKQSQLKGEATRTRLGHPHCRPPGSSTQLSEGTRRQQSPALQAGRHPTRGRWRVMELYQPWLNRLWSGWNKWTLTSKKM